jgi:hypothetical protein
VLPTTDPTTYFEKYPSKRSWDFLAIYALEELKAKEAVPQLHLLLEDNDRIHFDGQGTVAEAARKTVTSLDALP